MTAIGFLFPGQGSQRVGMGSDLVAMHPDLLDRFYRTADDILGMELSQLCFEGSAEELRRTDITQPAVFLSSVVALEVLRRKGLQPDVVAGHSLGEYAALVAAGSLEWTDALQLVRRRGQLMAAVNERSAGGMAAVIGLPLDTVAAMCASVQAQTGEIVEVANDNDPRQVVVSGHRGALAELAASALAAGAERVVALQVGAPFHCSLMTEIADEFDAALSQVTFRDPLIPIVANVTAAPVTTAADAVMRLRQQLAGRVRWTGTLQLLAANGVGAFVEVGPGRVLAGFCRATCPDIPVYAGGELRRISQTVAALSQAERPSAEAA